jgi:Transposase IS66 family
MSKERFITIEDQLLQLSAKLELQDVRMRDMESQIALRDKRISDLERELAQTKYQLRASQKKCGIYEKKLNLVEKKLRDREEKLEAALAELRRLKKVPAKPKLLASKLDVPQEEPSQEELGSKSATEENSSVKRPGSEKEKKKKNLKIHDRKEVKAVGVPAGWVLSGYESYVIQDMVIRANNIDYQREVWTSPDGKQRMVAELPVHLQGKHFGEQLVAYILHQYYHCGASQPVIASTLEDYGVSISSGQLSHILTRNKEAFHEEKYSLLATAIELGEELRTDDTGARHKFKNGFCNCINSDLFTFFTSTHSKSRINFLEILRMKRSDYKINEAALAYAQHVGLCPKYYDVLHASYEAGQTTFADKEALQTYFKSHAWKGSALRVIEEAVLIGVLIEQGLDSTTLIHSDGARQFKLYNHSLCWKHAERPLLLLHCYNEEQEQHFAAKKHAFWTLYQDLKAYKHNPQPERATQLYAQFDELCQPVSGFAALNQVLADLKTKANELLLVLSNPKVSLHNNASERDIREFVKRRKISAGTRSEDGRRSRDTFLSLKKTCLKLGVSFWDYLLDRLTNAAQIPALSTLMRLKCASG